MLVFGALKAAFFVANSCTYDYTVQTYSPPPKPHTELFMNASLQSVGHPLHSKYREGDRLAAEITELCSYIYAATYQLLLKIREFDENEYRGVGGVCSCAHWLNFKCGIGMNAAREKVRVAHALSDLPLISEAFRKGQVSYSKVRAMTRFADESNEDYLLMIANHGTAHHVEKLVSQYRRCKRLQDVENANETYKNRELHYFHDEDGSLVIKGRFPAEQGALLLKAIEMAMDAAENKEIDVAAKTFEPETYPTRRADALAEIAETYMQTEPVLSSTADRYQVVVHVTAETSPSQEVENAHIEDGPHVHPRGTPTAETSRRIACDCTAVGVVDGEKGEPLSIGRRSRTIPPALRRALRFKDKGCRFPGCTNTRFIDGHHIEHWADGGETSMNNLVQLCRRHHRLVHEGGFECERRQDGKFVFRDARSGPVSNSVSLPDIDPREDLYDWFERQDQFPKIDADTCVPNWYAGDTMDWDLAVGHLFPYQDRPR
jgi:hypothetical protein